MASNVLCGQAGLRDLPSVENADGDNSIRNLADAEIHPFLRADRKQLKTDANAGIEVYKISKNGKLQARRLAVSPNNRCLLITTNRVRSLKGLFRAATGNNHDPISTKVIDVSRIDHIVKGQLTNRFLMQNNDPDDHNQYLDNGETGTSNFDNPFKEYEKTSLTIVYRKTQSERTPVLSTSTSLEGFLSGTSVGTGIMESINLGGGGRRSSSASVVSNVTGDESVSFSVTSGKNLKGKGKKVAASSCAYYGGYECLDLCLMDVIGYEQLVETLEELLDLYHEERRWMERSVLLFQHHWIDMGRTGLHDPISVGEWVNLCNRLNAPLEKNEVKLLYKDMQTELKRACKELGTEFDFLDSGLPPWAIAELLKDLHFQSTKAMGLKYSKQDPTLRLWHEILESDPVPILNKDGSRDPPQTKITINESEGPDMTISPVAFLSFIRSHQKEYKATMENVTLVIRAIHAQKSFKDIAAEILTEDEDGSTHPRDRRLTKAEFMDFLLSDANDLMDPHKGKELSDDMTHPLSSYWIMTSHDTYLDCWNRDHAVLDEQMYLAALYRGVKCLELDIYDGFLLGPDGAAESVIAREKPTSVDDSSMNVRVAFGAVRQFLLGNKDTFPVILNIENHCSYEVQEKLANYIYRDLGAYGLIVVPDNSGSMDVSDLLPSPDSMRGRVLIMGKRPSVIADGAKVINDDFDDENDVSFDDIDLMIPNIVSSEDDEIEKNTVIGFDVNGPIRVYNQKELKNFIKHSPGELLFIANEELEVAKMKTAQVETLATELQEESKKAILYADKLIRSTGLSDEAVYDLLNQLNGKDIDPDHHLDILEKTQEEGVEVPEYFADAVVSAKLSSAEAEQYALRKAEDANRALQKLNHATGRLREAEALLETSYVKGKKVVSKYQKAAKLARDKQEIASHAHRRVEKLRQMLQECETGTTSANNVVNTAMTEAKISEKRAAETEARAARAAATALNDRARAEEETKKEEALEQQAGELHQKLAEVARKEKEMKMKAENAAITMDKLDKQIKLIESSSQYLREKQEFGQDEEKKESAVKGGKIHIKHAAKIEERKEAALRIEELASEIDVISKQKAQSQDAFEKKAHQWKNQAGIASKFRRTVDKSSHVAEDLAEHAEEEREAANLRKVARDKAQSHVTEKGSYKAGLEAQLAEAKRATKEADTEAETSRKEADRLAKAHENYESSGYEDIFSITERRKETRSKLLAEYEKRKAIQTKAEERATELRRQYEKSDNFLADTMQTAALREQVAKNQRQEDKNALLAVNNARSLQKKAQHAIDEVSYAQSVVTEKRCIVKRAEEYKVKTDRVVEIPTQLAGMTFLHTTRHKHWEKSLQLPSTYVHSFAEGILEQMVGKSKEDHMINLKKFTSSHLCRSFRSWKDTQNSVDLNSDPLFQWSLGCQLVALNYGTYDEHLLKADGRFRRNGSCGYTLKPEFLRNYDSIPERPESWKINVLCGSCLPSPERHQRNNGITFINPFVKINIYGGDQEKRKGEHITRTVERNGLNPVFDDTIGIIFKATNPSLAILTFTVWSKTEDGDEFIAGSSMPVSCIREGYRSVPLFDKQNTRAGAFAYSYLLVKAKRVT
mmetsp:Transcript_22154/g.52677  ORF Transcript_22154/g.52677 Transcript_22154/m.52677 type:complete len:1596 (+) Transcript_22154:305-5092(+)|eukprot:CAMPEP_0197190840 /NCGR_PEP_ID=MMETSP1423-20130617/22343_1 /TAXON_ID=476441 /ORGANISM="Pseudo-nitzschia heimii, Strain UNC1101" /LENGTH=1595 /DNA_ID=CAMNT_0042643307 /DNA_START=214 /DNA_END=5004 /DNA_ORIENTATION=-